ncbi:MAG: hypothetical protein VX776_10400, partial [Planctomycetota bacterium]|nr:hypothetical protein [Planctomycetota bacterium]
MPATDKTVRDIKKMHVIFAITSVILVLSTVWMFWKDHDRPWKEYQKEARAIDLKVSEWRLMETETADVLSRVDQARLKLQNAQSSSTEGVESIGEFIEFLERTESLQVAGNDPVGSGAMELAELIEDGGFVQMVEEARDDWSAGAAADVESLIESREAMAFTMNEVVRLLKAKEDKILSDTKFKRANRDETASQLGIAFSSGASDEEKTALQEKLNEMLEDPETGLNAYELKYEKATRFRRQLAAIGNQFQVSVRAAQKGLDEVNA